MAETKGIALAILGIVAVIAVVGLVLLFKGGTGQVSYSTWPVPFIEEDAQRLCNDIQCQNGMGAIVIGEKSDYWVCGCPEFFADQRISSWSNAWKGDEANHGLEFPNADNAFLIRKFREY
jgi:hypothetical protein